MVSRVRLGKREHTIVRYSEGHYEKGRWVEGEEVEHKILANIQPSFSWKMVQLLPEGDRDKDMVAIYSNMWLHASRSGEESTKGDILLYRGTRWRIVLSLPYGNFGEHCEAIAVRMDKEEYEREDGVMGVVN